MYRFGQFLIVIGLLLLVFFAASLQSGEYYIPFCIGFGVCISLGVILVARNRPPRSPSARFRTINKFRGVNSKEKKQ